MLVHNAATVVAETKHALEIERLHSIQPVTVTSTVEHTTIN